MEKNCWIYFKSAQKLKLPIDDTLDIGGFSICLGKKKYYFRSCQTPFNSESSAGIASNKYCTNQILKQAGFPVANAYSYHRDTLKTHTPESLIRDLKFPLVIKPMCGGFHGNNVLCNIKNTHQFKKNLYKRFENHDFLTIEEFHENLNHYRVLVFFNRVIGVVQRFPAHVTGDGIHTIKQLIGLKNIEREKLKESISLGSIKIDDEMLIRLKELKITLKTIPSKGEKIVLLDTCNSTRGGTMESLDKQICQENAKLICRASRALNLNFVGFDITCENIMLPIEKSRGIIVEANRNPDISIHEQPLYGTKNPVSKKILRKLIWMHPFAYAKGLYKDKRIAFYFRLAVASFIGIIVRFFLLRA